MLLITDRIHADELCKQVQKGNFSSFRLAAFLILNSPDPDEHKESAGQTLPLSAPVLSMSAQETIEYIKKNWVDEIVLVVSPTLETGSITKAALTMGITVHIGITTLTESITSAPTTIDSIGDLDVVSVFEHGISEWNVILKRIMDIAGGLIGCIITVILTIIIGPMIFFSSPGPIFFSQNRVGKNGKIFRMYKFRSMVQNADKIKEQFAAQNRVSDGMMFKLDWDPRIIGNQILPDGTRKTGIGEFIRKTSLDEFPQFFNVLRGDMSLVGTRPPTLDEWAKYQQHHRARMSIKPGITGLWQVSGRSEITDFEEVVRLDTQYIENWSLANDVRILMRTVLTVLRKEGSM